MLKWAYLSHWRLVDAGRLTIRTPLAYLAFILLILAPTAASSRDGESIWDSRCEECHGDPAEFASKYLWNIEGQLQGQHHVEDLYRFLGNHYIPAHQIDIIRDLLLARANSPARYTEECAGCHGDARDYVQKTLWVGEKAITVIVSGRDVGELLPHHQGLPPEDVPFYLRLFFRVAGKSFPYTPIPSLR